MIGSAGWIEENVSKEWMMWLELCKSTQLGTFVSFLPVILFCDLRQWRRCDFRRSKYLRVVGVHRRSWEFQNVPATIFSNRRLYFGLESWFRRDSSCLGRIINFKNHLSFILHISHNGYRYKSYHLSCRAVTSGFD
jgi:hypothetical protein